MVCIVGAGQVRKDSESLHNGEAAFVVVDYDGYAAIGAQFCEPYHW